MPPPPASYPISSLPLPPSLLTLLSPFPTTSSLLSLPVPTLASSLNVSCEDAEEVMCVVGRAVRWEGDRGRVKGRVLKMFEGRDNDVECVCFLKRATFNPTPTTTRNLPPILTGSKSMDEILSVGNDESDCVERGKYLGGFERGVVSEVFGRSGSGKTSIAVSACVNAAVAYDDDAFNGNCFTIDYVVCEGGGQGGRNVARRVYDGVRGRVRKGKGPGGGDWRDARERAMSRVNVVSVRDAVDLVEYLRDYNAKSLEGGRVRGGLLVIDGVKCLLLRGVVGVGYDDMRCGMRVASDVAGSLRKAAELGGVAVVVCNGYLKGGGCPVKRSWDGVSDVRVDLGFREGRGRTAVVRRSVFRKGKAWGKVQGCFEVWNGGVRDVG